MKSDEFIKLEHQVLLNTYARPDFVINRGDGCFLYDTDGKAYLDFVAGIAVCAFGHADPRSQLVLAEQAAKLWHCSNLYHTEPQVRLAEFLVKNTFADKVFFCNSGTEAIEATIKFARKWAHAVKGEGCFEIISMKRSFHGRTYGALSSTGQTSLQEGFEPLLPGFQFAVFNDVESIRSLVSETTCAILIEPVQGEGGIYPATEEFVQGVRQLCDDHHLLLILDEIQCGFGRTGNFCAHESYGVVPDIMAAAKPIAAGLPLGAVLLNDQVAEQIKPGDHGTTFGGGPLTTAVALDVLQRIIDAEFLQQVREKGDYFRLKLENLMKNYDSITAVRNRGLMLAIELSIEPKSLIQACAEEGLLICKTGGPAVRFLPPLNITRELIDQGVEKLARALAKMGEKGD